MYQHNILSLGRNNLLEKKKTKYLIQEKKRMYIVYSYEKNSIFYVQTNMFLVKIRLVTYGINEWDNK